MRNGCVMQLDDGYLAHADEDWAPVVAGAAGRLRAALEPS
jgi:hypothetical protein